MKETITDEELKKLKEQKVQFIEESDYYEDEVYQTDKGLIYLSQIALSKYAELLKFVRDRLNKFDFEKFSKLLNEQNNAIFEEYERLNYLYYEFGKKQRKNT